MKPIQSSKSPTESNISENQSVVIELSDRAPWTVPTYCRRPLIFCIYVTNVHCSASMGGDGCRGRTAISRGRVSSRLVSVINTS